MGMPDWHRTGRPAPTMGWCGVRAQGLAPDVPGGGPGAGPDRRVGSGVEGEADLPRLAVGREAELGQGLVGVGVLLADLVDLPGLLARGDLTVELVRDADELLDLLDRSDLLAAAAPDRVLVAAPSVQAECDGHRVDGEHAAHERLQGEAGTVGDATDELHHVVGVRAVEAATDGNPGEVERTRVEAAA